MTLSELASEMEWLRGKLIRAKASLEEANANVVDTQADYEAAMAELKERLKIR
jgi:hypothetical protein